MISLNYYLSNISKKLFISYGTLERTKIDKSVNYIQDKLEAYFDDWIDEIIIFGSYTRGTILPRKYDKYSDIDMMIVFNTSEYEELNPESYRNNLKRFVDKVYPRSISSKDLPSIVLELSKIKFDLIPAIIENNWFSTKIYIPNSGVYWQTTDPNGFNEKITAANQAYGNIVKPIVRLVKYWNSKNGKPYDSFELEIIISEMDFSSGNLEDGFFYAIENLPTYGRTENLMKKVEILRNRKNWVEEYLRRGNKTKAKEWLHKILP